MVLVGEYPAESVRRQCRENGWGYLFIYKDPNPYEGQPWGVDNGAYLDWINQREFDERRFLTRVDVALSIGVPNMAVIPDLVAQGLRSLEFSMNWLGRLPDHWPWYLALQDGMTERDVLPVLDSFSGLFLGGTDSFKRQAELWCQFAHRHGKRFHFARAGTERKIKQAIRIGADSLDSSFPLWTTQRLRRMEYLVNEWHIREPRLFVSAETRY